MRHRALTISIQEPGSVSHFERQLTAAFTSYNPFYFSKVASDHVLLEAAGNKRSARNPQAV
jgi:hypothetical protein